MVANQSGGTKSLGNQLRQTGDSSACKQTDAHNNGVGCDSNSAMQPSFRADMVISILVQATDIAPAATLGWLAESCRLIGSTLLCMVDPGPMDTSAVSADSVGSVHSGLLPDVDAHFKGTISTGSI